MGHSPSSRLAIVFDPYLDENGVQRNKLGITDPVELERLEKHSVTIRPAVLDQYPPALPFNITVSPGARPFPPDG
jgi:fido (protein-threonine AMPylation protein)